MPRQYSACLARVSGSKPPTPFLDELVDWAMLAPDELFQDRVPIRGVGACGGHDDSG